MIQVVQMEIMKTSKNMETFLKCGKMMCLCYRRDHMANRERKNWRVVWGGIGRGMGGIVVEWKIGINSNWNIIMYSIMGLDMIYKYKVQVMWNIPGIVNNSA